MLFERNGSSVQSQVHLFYNLSVDHALLHFTSYLDHELTEHFLPSLRYQ